tara:strand:+ start:1665 stop:1907 length:243 start_codon:yes stop_codon:yes gene_type:complete
MAFALLDNLMAPLGKEHCTVYYILGLLTLFFAVLAVLNGLFLVFDKKTRTSGFFLMLNSLTMFFMYYLYRIVYSICIKAL